MFQSKNIKNFLKFFLFIIDKLIHPIMWDLPIYTVILKFILVWARIGFIYIR